VKYSPEVRERAEVIGGFLRHLDAAEHMQVELEQKIFNCAVVGIAAEGPEYLGQYQVAYHHDGKGEKLIEFGGGSVVFARVSIFLCNWI
jgi:hypothetical protein